MAASFALPNGQRVEHNVLMPCRGTNEVGQGAMTYNRVVMLLGTAAIPLFLRLLHNFSNHKRMGVLIIM